MCHSNCSNSCIYYLLSVFSQYKIFFHKKCKGDAHICVDGDAYVGDNENDNDTIMMFIMMMAEKKKKR